MLCLFFFAPTLKAAGLVLMCKHCTQPCHLIKPEPERIKALGKKRPTEKFKGKDAFPREVQIREALGEITNFIEFAKSIINPSVWTKSNKETSS